MADYGSATVYSTEPLWAKRQRTPKTARCPYICSPILECIILNRMDIAIQKELTALTTRFYAEQAESFSDTRHSAWPGWERCAWHIRTRCMGDELHILDVGCGNMRFEQYLSAALSQRELVFETIDNCAALIPNDVPTSNISHHELDVAGALIDRRALWGTEIAPVDVACSFGVMHHMPGEQNRVALLKALLGSVRPGGLVLVSLWRFMDVDQLAAKAHDTLRAALNDERLSAALRVQLFDLAARGDYLLGWQNKPGAYRYCHSFSDADTEALLASVADTAKLIERFGADGRTGCVNEYLVLQRQVG